MADPVIITVAITGALPRKADSPAVPVTPPEQIESIHEAFEAGAAIAHIHVRNPDETPSSDPALFAEVQEGVKRHCPGMIIQHSTGGRGRDQAQRGGCITLRPDMASLSTGSVNFPNQIYENPPQFVDGLAQSMLDHGVKPEIEVFDSAMLYAAKSLLDRKLLKGPAHVQFVMGVPNAMPARRTLLTFLVSELHEIMPDATWTGAGIGRHQLEMNEWCLDLGGHARTGLEDNLRYDRTRLAASNAELVARLVRMAHECGRGVATVAQARAMLSLPAA